MLSSFGELCSPACFDSCFVAGATAWKFPGDTFVVEKIFFGTFGGASSFS
jgi:hypothetical protein